MGACIVLLTLLVAPCWLLAGFAAVWLFIFMTGADFTVSSISVADLNKTVVLQYSNNKHLGLTYLTLLMQDASSVMSEMETSSLVGVEQAFLVALIFSGVVFSSTALSQTSIADGKTWSSPHLSGLLTLSLRDVEDFVDVMYLDDTLQEGKVLFFTD